MKRRLKAECLVPQHLALVLRVSWLAGIAPLRIARTRDGWLVRVAPAMNVYGYLLITAINVCTTIAVAFDMSVPAERSVRMHSETRRLVWIADVIIVIAISSVGAYAAPAQMRRTIGYVNRIQRVKSELNIYIDSSSETKQYNLIVAALMMSLLIFIVDFAIVMYSAIHESCQVVVAIMYSSYYCSYIIIQLLEMQFVLIASYAVSTLRLINSRLKSLLPKNDFDYRESTSTSRTSQQNIRRLALSYSTVCDVVRLVDKNNGTILLLLLGSFLLHLIITPYYLIMSLFNDLPQSPWEKYSNPVLQLIWCAFHMINLIAIIEPCHRTHAEMNLTKELVGHLICTKASAYDPVSNELEMFLRRLTLTQVTYAPLQVCTLTRSLIATILGSITTYLAVIIQL